MEKVSYFKTFEEREAQFRQQVCSLLPRQYSGPAVFLKDMAVAISGITDLQQMPINWISCNPRDSLAYSYVDDLLSATVLLLPNFGKEVHLSEAIIKYDIEPIRGQQIHTLSGGEVVRLALAKNDLLSSIAETVVISSPLTWLSPSSQKLYSLFLESYIAKKKDVLVLAMEGEYDQDPVSFSVSNNVESEIIFDNLTIKLSSDDFESEIHEEWAIIEDVHLKFKSPCILSGDNGSGKSIMARALSGVLKSTGSATVATNGYSGKSRMLFQDVILQSMLRPISVLSKTATSSSHSEVLAKYHALISSFIEYFTHRDLPVPPIGFTESDFGTLLEYKFMLVGLRLCSRPTAIILDEPDWGLSKDTAIGFVKSVIDIAHNDGVPVIIISHKNWWASIAETRLRATKQIVAKAGVKYKFRIDELKLERRELNELEA